jgi:hypothetical protein
VLTSKSYSQDAYHLNQVNQAFIYGKKHQELGITRKGTYPDIFYISGFVETEGGYI